MAFKKINRKQSSKCSECDKRVYNLTHLSLKKKTLRGQKLD